MCNKAMIHTESATTLDLHPTKPRGRHPEAGHTLSNSSNGSWKAEGSIIDPRSRHAEARDPDFDLGEFNGAPEAWVRAPTIDPSACLNSLRPYAQA